MQPTQDAPAEIIFKLWPWLEANKTRLIGAGVAVVIIFGIYSFITGQKVEREAEAGRALTQLLMTPPAGANPSDALSSLATKYSGTQAAQRAQLQASATLFSVGRYADAQAGFQKFLENSPGGALAATAQLGVAASLEAQGKNDLAAAAYLKTASTYSATPSALPALCALGRINEQAGKLNEAANHYDAAARAGQAGGSLAQEAAMHSAEIKAKIAAQKSPAAPAVIATPAAPVK